MKNWQLFLALLCCAFVAILLYLKLCSSFSFLSDKPVVVIIGDSNSDINSITDVKKWSQDYAEAHTYDQIVLNLSLGGHAVEDFNTSETYNQLVLLSKSVKPETPIIVVTLLGTNNAIMMNKLDTPEQFTRNYEILLTQITNILHPRSILLASIPPAYPQPANVVPYVPNFKAYKLIDQLNVALNNWVLTKRNIGSATLHFLPIMPKDSYEAANMTTYFISDGIHFNRDTQDIVYDKISPAIHQLLEKTE